MNIELIDTTIPEKEHNAVGWPGVVRDFVESGSMAALVRVDGGDGTLTTAMLNRANVGLRNAIERQKAPARVVKRGSRLYLKRTE